MRRVDLVAEFAVFTYVLNLLVSGHLANAVFSCVLASVDIASTSHSSSVLVDESWIFWRTKWLHILARQIEAAAPKVVKKGLFNA